MADEEFNANTKTITSDFVLPATYMWHKATSIVPVGLPITTYTFTVTTTGNVWTANPANGLYSFAGDPKHPHAAEGYTLPGAPEGALVCKIGANGAPFLPGGDYSRDNKNVQSTDRDVYFMINDDVNGIYGAGLKDNEGSLTISITIESVEK